MQYEYRILKELLDRYENSLLSRGENKVTVHVSFPFTKKTMPSYFDESSLAYEEIHAAAKHLEQMEYASIGWKDQKTDHIIQKVVLREDHVDEAYQYMKRTPKSQFCLQQQRTLRQLADECQTPTASAFVACLTERLEQGKSVKEYLDITDTETTKRLVRTISAIEENQEDVYIREFSVRCFGDTKMLEKRLGVIGKIMRQFSGGCENMETQEILAEHGIYHTPNYVYIKGTGVICVGRENSGVLDLQKLRQGIGLSGEDLDTLRWLDVSAVKRIITIENLTTFFRWKEENSILIYLGGYQNTVRRKLLQHIYEMLPQAEYLHFGDIDVGGFEIYLNLCKKTGIAFQPYLMGTEQLQQYRDYTRKLSENDRKRLELLLRKEENPEIRAVLEYMKKYGIKLEQECMLQV